MTGKTMFDELSETHATSDAASQPTQQPGVDEGKYLGKSVFAGVKILDFGWAIAGPLSLKYLADYGAMLVCIESTQRPDLLRTSAPFRDGKADVNRAGFFAYFAANKYSISLDLTTAAGRDIARRLVAWADIVGDSHRPGVLESWGLGYEELRKIKPDLIVIRSSNQGLTGPAAKQPGLGHHINGLGGIVNLAGWPDEEPISLLVAYTDYCVPHFAAAALVGALDYRRKTGRGQLIDISQYEAGLHLIAPLLLEYSANGVEAKANGNACAYAAPHGVFRCKGEDRWCAITVFTDAEWESLCRAMGNPQWTKAFMTLLGRKKNEPMLNELLEQWTSQYEPEKLMNLLQQEGVAAGAVLSAKDICEDEQLKVRGCFWKVNHRELGMFSHLGQPSRLSSTPARMYRDSPSLGEHNVYICMEVLSMSEEDYVQCVIDGAFGQ
jgi:crotonobetainyl-CoA:carnitine CoA-transferase CaiB-like acyl-CoA transferase